MHGVVNMKSYQKLQNKNGDIDYYSVITIPNGLQPHLRQCAMRPQKFQQNNYTTPISSRCLRMHVLILQCATKVIRDLMILLINYTFFLIRTALTVLLAIGITGIRRRLWVTSTIGDIDTKKPLNTTSQLGQMFETSFLGDKSTPCSLILFNDPFILLYNFFQLLGSMLLTF